MTESDVNVSGRSAKDKGVRVGDRTKAWHAARVHVEGQLEEGMPIQPADPALRGNHKFMAGWHETTRKLADRHLLAKSDGDAVIAFVKAKYEGAQDVAALIAKASWGNRKPFATSFAEIQADTIQDFIVSVKRERETFHARMVPRETLTLEMDNQPYSWEVSDAATVAKRYASDVLSGAIIAGELLKMACRRFMKDLETGASRGFWFDVVAARHIIKFTESFCGLKLLPWEVFVLSNMFAWKKPGGTRRFTEFWVSCAKKNGKTGLAAAVGLWGLLCDQAEHPDIFSAATKKEQARLVFRDAKRMVADNKYLREYVQRWNHALSVDGVDNASFSPLSSDTKSMDGLRPYYVLADEVAFWSSNDQWDKLQKGMVIYEQPIMLGISTAGDSRECFSFGMFEAAEKILRGLHKNDCVFVCIFSVDPKDDTLKDESCWYKANPSLGIIVLLEKIREQRDKVLQNPAHMTKWLQLQCNIWPDMSASSASITHDKWAACSGLELIGGGKLSPSEACKEFMRLNVDVPLYMGLDIGLVNDLTCVTLLWPSARFVQDGPIIKKYVLLVQAFMPEIGMLDKERAWGVPLSQWWREGWINLQPGDMVDPRLVKKWIANICSTFVVRELGFDPWNSRVIGAELVESGIVRAVEVGQSEKEITAPAQEFLTAVSRKDLVHFNNPYLAWNACNVILTEDERHGGIKPDKPLDKAKIDAVQSTLDAWHRLLAGPGESAYLNKGIQFLS